MSHTTLTQLASFEDILDQLETLARDHLLLYRVQVGSLLLQHFWDGDSAKFSLRGQTTEMRFDLFFEKCGEDLARYGLSKRQARDSIRASIVVRTLPTAVAERLFLSHRGRASESEEWGGFDEVVDEELYSQEWTG